MAGGGHITPPCSPPASVWCSSCGTSTDRASGPRCGTCGSSHVIPATNPTVDERFARYCDHALILLGVHGITGTLTKDSEDLGDCVKRFSLRNAVGELVSTVCLNRSMLNPEGWYVCTTLFDKGDMDYLHEAEWE